MTTISFGIYTIFIEIVMETMNSPLFHTPESTPRIVLNSIKELSEQSYKPTSLQAPIEQALNSFLPDQSEENKVARMRKHLGKTAETLSNPQVETIITEFQFLIDTWMDEYEREVFNGLTLKEVLNEG